MLGILTEKPSAARNFAKALGGMSGTYQGTSYVIVNSAGHLFEYDSPDKQVISGLVEHYKKWSLQNLPWNETDFAWKRSRKKDAAGLLKQIRAGLAGCDEIAIATDVDPTGEGELLAWEILDELGFTKEKKKFSRFYFMDEAPASIQKAFVTRKPIQDMWSDDDFRKSYYRSKFDFMTMQFTRIATVLTGVKLRQGRLKSYMVQIVGDALAALAAYKKVPYYQWRFKDVNGNIFTDPNELQFPNKADCKPTYKDADVVVDKTEKKFTPPPKLLDLSALSSILEGRGIKSKQILVTYQKMYEDQVVSYPRTEDKFITPEQFNEMMPFVDKIAHVVGVDASLLTHRQPRSTHVKTGGAHGANRPGTNVPNSLDDLSKYGTAAKPIYEILAKNFLAMLCEDYEYQHQTGHLQQYPNFKGSANQTVSMGYKLVFSDADDDDDTTGKLLGATAAPFIYEGFPTKPPVPTMKWMMKQLEKYDVGTGATRTSIYAEITDEKSPDALLKAVKGKLSLTDNGRMSYLILPGTHIGSLSLTEDMQKDMRDIAAGKTDAETCLAKIKTMVVEDIETMQKNMTQVRKEFTNMTGGFVQKEKHTGVYKPTGQQVSFNKVFGDHTFSDEEIEKLLNGEVISFETISARTGNPYTAVGKLAEQVFNGNKFWRFQFDKDTFRCPNQWGGHTFTDDEKQALEDGQSIYVQDCVSNKTGRYYSVTLYVGEEDGKKKIIPKFK